MRGVMNNTKIVIAVAIGIIIIVILFSYRSFRHFHPWQTETEVEQKTNTPQPSSTKQTSPSKQASSSSKILSFLHLAKALQSYSQEEGVLVDPETAPEKIRPLVMKGLYTMLETQKHAPAYAGDRITCTNCHFSGGNTLGGENNGISLV